MRIARAVTVAILLSSHPVSAVTVVPTHGAVRISSEGGFKPLDQAVEVAPLTRVMVAPGGLATIVYASNCQVKVTNFATVLAKPPCTGDFAQPSRLGMETGPSISEADDDYGFTPKVGSRSRPRPADDPCIFDHHTLLVIGGVALAAGATILLLSDGGGDAPASP